MTATADRTRTATRDLHVVMAIQKFRPLVGGGELQLERLLPHLAERGVRATVVTRAVSGTPRRDAVAGAPVRRTPVAGESPLASLAYVTTALAHAAAHRHSIDVVHAHGALSPATIALGATAFGIPAVVTPLGAGAPGDLRRVQRKPGGRFRLRMTVERAHFVSLSDEISEELRTLGVDARRLHAIPNGVDTRRFHPVDTAHRAMLRAELGLPHDALVFVFAGRLHPVKSVDTVIDALGAVPGAELVVVGDGPERAALERRAEAAGVRPRVRFVGFDDRTDRWLQAADGFVLPSIAEGMPNALVEAMACGAACIASSASGGIRQLLTPDRGMCVEPRDVHAWAAAMSSMGDAGRREAFGRAAASFVHTNLSIERTADALAALYRELAAA